jgi:flagellar motor switch protein FliM
LYTFDIKNTDIKGILELNLDLVLTLVDRLLGGSGSGTKQVNVITPIEQKVIGVIAERVMLDLRKSWQIIDDMEFRVERFESDIDFAQITSQSESVLLISFEIIIGEQSYMMNLCFATFAFDKILAKLATQKLSTIRTSKHAGITTDEIITNHLYRTFLPITVEFGTAKISMQNLFDLDKGDIILLDNAIDDEHPVKIGNKLLYYGRAGVVNKHKAIKITRKVEQNNKPD